VRCLATSLGDAYLCGKLVSLEELFFGWAPVQALTLAKGRKKIIYGFRKIQVLCSYNTCTKNASIKRRSIRNVTKKKHRCSGTM
jgi:hypothetical protein